MNDDLDTLRPEVREAVHRTDVTVEMFDTLVTVNRDDYDTIRAELLRLSAMEHAWKQWIKDGMHVEFLPPEPPK